MADTTEQKNKPAEKDPDDFDPQADAKVAGEIAAEAKGKPSGELVAPSDPRAADEIAGMLDKLSGPEPSAQEIAMAIAGGDTLPDADVQQSQAGIVARILAATDTSKVLDMGEPMKAEELEQVALEVNGVRWMKSALEGGAGVYAVVDAVRLDQDEPVKITTGSVNVMAQLLKLQTMGAFPQKVKIVKAGRPTKSGYYPYWLQPA